MHDSETGEPSCSLQLCPYLVIKVSPPSQVAHLLQTLCNPRLLLGRGDNFEFEWQWGTRCI
jgi:hypothetical protein